MLADAIIAKKEEADRVGQSRNPAEEFGGFGVKGLDPIKLATLEEAITGKRTEPHFTILHQESDEGPVCSAATKVGETSDLARAASSKSQPAG